MPVRCCGLICAGGSGQHGRKAAEDVALPMPTDKDRVMVTVCQSFRQMVPAQLQQRCGYLLPQYRAGLDIQRNPDNPELTLCYIDDLLAEFIAALEGGNTRPMTVSAMCETYRVRLFELAELLVIRKAGLFGIPDMADAFTHQAVQHLSVICHR